MKTKLFSSASIIAFMLFTTSGLYAQPGHEFHKGMGVKFTDEQKAKMKEIHLASYKEMNALKNQMGELRAKQHTLTTSDKPDMASINANIDEMTKVRNKMMKIRAADHQKIRALLTDEQKMMFDSKMMHRGGKHRMFQHDGDGGHQESMEHQEDVQHS